MQILILALGTRGDVELFLALARELTERGHDVTLASSAFYRNRVEQQGVGYAAVGDGTQSDLVSILSSLATVRDKTERTYQYYLRWVRRQLSVGEAELASLAKASDYFISNLKLTLRRGASIIPGASVTYDPPIQITDLAKYGPERPEILDLVALDRQLVDPDNQWPARFRFTGFWWDVVSDSIDLPTGLEKFIERGAPPVVLTMGSMTTFDTGKLLLDFTGACAIQKAVGDERYARATKEWQRHVCQTNGVKVAADLIETHGVQHGVK